MSDSRSVLTHHGIRPLVAAAATNEVDESALVWRAAVCRRGFRGAGLSFPASIAQFDAAANWLRRTKACVTVYSTHELRTVVAAGISPGRLMVRLHGDQTDIPACVRAGVGRFVVDGEAQVAALSATGRPALLVVDVDSDVDSLVAAILAAPHLAVCGLHHGTDSDSVDPLGMQAIRRAIDTMAHVRSGYGTLLTHMWLDRVVLGRCSESPRLMRHIAEAYDDITSEACEHHRYPRPVVSMTPCESSLLVRPQIRI